MLNQDLPTDVIPSNSTWTTCEGGYMRTPFLPTQGEPVFVPTATLAEIDARLPHAFTLYQKTVARVTGGALQELLKLWNNAVLLRTNHARNIAVLEVLKFDVQETFVHIDGRGYEYKLHPNPDGGEPLLLHSGTGFINHEKIHRCWLDATYPDWLSKYHIAEVIGFDLSACVRHMVSKEPQLKSLNTPFDLLP